MFPNPASQSLVFPFLCKVWWSAAGRLELKWAKSLRWRWMDRGIPADRLFNTLNNFLQFVFVFLGGDGRTMGILLTDTLTTLTPSTTFLPLKVFTSWFLGENNLFFQHSWQVSIKVGITLTIPPSPHILCIKPKFPSNQIKFWTISRDYRGVHIVVIITSLWQLDVPNIVSK